MYYDWHTSMQHREAVVFNMVVMIPTMFASRRVDVAAAAVAAIVCQRCCCARRSRRHCSCSMSVPHMPPCHAFDFSPPWMKVAHEYHYARAPFLWRASGSRRKSRGGGAAHRATWPHASLTRRQAGWTEMCVRARPLWASGGDNGIVHDKN